MPAYPVIFQPIYKNYVWGGNKISTIYKRQCESCAESWEIAAHADGMSIAANGPLAGRSLLEIINTDPQAWLGSGHKMGEHFPILVKLLDAKQRLSLQVHPNSSNAHLTGGEPKTEAWYILDAEPGAQVFAGWTRQTQPVELEAALATGNAETLLNRIPVETGDVIYIPGGRVHAIDAGCLLLEVQQSSNTTYRVYDWGRGRPLQVDAAIKTIDWDDIEPTKSRPLLELETDYYQRWHLLGTPFFHLDKHVIAAPTGLNRRGRDCYCLVFVERGKVGIQSALGSLELPTGTTGFIPAAAADCTLVNLTPTASYLTVLGGE